VMSCQRVSSYYHQKMQLGALQRIFFLKRSEEDDDDDDDQ